MAFMLLIVSLFLICAVVPPRGEAVRRHQRAIWRRKQIEAFLRSSPVAEYRLDGAP
jgi:hypothetical protein